MFALHQSQEVETSVIQYLKDTFQFNDKELRAAFDDFITDPERGMFKGPFIALKLPFVTATKAEDSPLEIRPNFPPYAHQLKAFERLTTENNHVPQSTLLTTGTGSGKTEAFLYPILDFCYKNRERPGIKAIIMYPMNALATDQASRIAEIIATDPRLKGAVSAGLFIGLGDKESKYSNMMTDDKIIEDRQTILQSPPDILLTNFKMLDYALMRSDFHSLWSYNLRNPDLLQFLVLDELHTYDGAQGTDVANLIRRLKLKLSIEPDGICPVGTSATIGSGENSKALLADYAAKIFGVEIDEDSIITEERQTPEVFFEEVDEIIDFIPNNSFVYKFRLQEGDTFDKYLNKQLTLWQIEQEELVSNLKKYEIVQDLLEITSEGIVHFGELEQLLKSKNKDFAKIKPYAKAPHFNVPQALLMSIFALISTAKVGKFPFLFLQVQLWLREMSGILRTITPKPHFKWREDTGKEVGVIGMPPFYCRECGSSGWLMLKKDEHASKFRQDVNAVYQEFFSNRSQLFFVYPYSEDNLAIDSYQKTNTVDHWIDRQLNIYGSEEEGLIRVIGYQKLDNNRADHVCPHCNTRNTIAIIGTRTATLNSIATSQLLATNMDEAKLLERKVLAFSNSVQDAAHHAGFIKARNYNFTFRTAVQHVVNQQKEPVTLHALAASFMEYWQKYADEKGKNNLEAYFTRFLPSDKAARFNLTSKTTDAAFLKEFNHRMQWNIFSEFGYNAIIGRTLEKTGSAGTFFKEEILAKVHEALLPWFKEHFHEAAIPKAADFIRFLNILLHRIRIRGAIEHPYLRAYRIDKTSYYMLTEGRNKHHFMMKNFGKKTRLPRLITDQPFNNGRAGQSALDVTKRDSVLNWFHAYYIKNFDWATDSDKNAINELYSTLLDILESLDILDKKVAPTGNFRNFALSSTAIQVGKGAVHYECNKCGNLLNVHSEGNNVTADAKCMRFRCTGTYQTAEQQGGTYYQQVYNRLNVPRVNSFEHTGLLPRDKREDVEESFKRAEKYDDYNSLVATSTLEMGIDIGDLNNTTNISIPPMPSNFLQRVGRAGRKSGTAFILNMAMNKAHDIYYHTEPMEMMDGVVQPPGCHLSAKDILRRHFIAFCIDSWTSLSPTLHHIPYAVRDIRLRRLKVNDSNFFINQILSHIELYQNTWVERFKGHYPNVEDVIFEEINHWINSKDLTKGLRKLFADLQNDFNQLVDRKNEVAKRRNELPKTSDERKELNKELSNLNGAIRSLRERSIIEHLTNTGWLPNYAFPETGVELLAQVRQQDAEEEEDRRAYPIEVIRPARSAIRELIPENKFYTQGYRLKISGITIPNEQYFETYRYCANCDHIELELQSPTIRLCPKCSHHGWSSDSQKHLFIKHRSVLSFNDEKQALIDDSSDEREQLFSSMSEHFHFENTSSQGAFAMVEIPFGIEYIKQVELMAINTGVVTDRAASGVKTKIKEKETPRMGFILCRHCGRANSTLFKENNTAKEVRDYHFAYCRHRDSTYQGITDEVFREVFIYRKLKTEALKILIPVYELESDMDIQLFKTGIHIGLKAYFGGNPQHLAITDYSELNEQTGQKNRYIIIYDTIPGGTGYLGDLFNYETFNQIIEAAYQQIKNCRCQTEGKDGCYHCVYTYQNQFSRHNLSRSRAEALFLKIVNASENWEQLSTGLGKLSEDARLEESRLEEKFIYLLKQTCEQEEPPYDHWNFNILKDENGKNKYQVKINGAIPLTYEIQPQVTLNGSNGIPFTTRPDFIIRCLTNEHKDAILPIAVYLDGYKYHASAEHNRVEQDLKIRNGLNKSGLYRTWTLSWEDLRKFEKREKDAFYKEELTWYKGKKKERIDKATGTSFEQSYLNFNRNNVERLLWQLENGLADFNKLQQILLYSFQRGIGKRAYQKENFLAFANGAKSIDDLKLYPKKGAICYLDTIPAASTLKATLGHEIPSFEVFGTVELSEVADTFYYDKAIWEQFWQLYNLIQGYSNVSLYVNEEEIYDATILNEIGKDERPALEDVLEEFDKELHEAVEVLYQKKIVFNYENSFSIIRKGRTAADAHLGLEDLKIVVGIKANPKLFEKEGYEILTIEEFLNHEILNS